MLLNLIDVGLQVPLEIGGKHYEIQYAAGASLEQVGREFCIRHAADFGITLDEQVPNCARPVVGFLSSHIPKAALPTVLTVCDITL